MFLVEEKTNVKSIPRVFNASVRCSPQYWLHLLQLAADVPEWQGAEGSHREDAGLAAARRLSFLQRVLQPPIRYWAHPPNSISLLHHNNGSDIDANWIRLKKPMNDWLLGDRSQYLFLDDEKTCYNFVTFCQGDSKRDFNPTCYRTDAQYSHLVQSVQAEGPEGGQKSGFDIVLKKKVKAYIEVESCQPSEMFSETWSARQKVVQLTLSFLSTPLLRPPSFSQMKNNPNQICWLLEKVPRSSDTENGFDTFQQFLDNQQYTNRGILRYEKMFGAGYVSTGGPSTTKVGMKSGEYQWVYARYDYYFPWCITLRRRSEKIDMHTIAWNLLPSVYLGPNIILISPTVDAHRSLSFEALMKIKNDLILCSQEFVDLLNLKPGQKVLDVGCGIGGGDFYMAEVRSNGLKMRTKGF